METENGKNMDGEKLTEPQKRGPGRPSKKDNAENINKVTAPSGNKRGPKAKAKIDIDGLAEQLVGLHLLGAKITRIDELAINERESLMLASAITNVCQQYNLAIDGKTGAFLQLLGTGAMIYFPRYVALQQRIKATKAMQEQGEREAEKGSADEGITTVNNPDHPLMQANA